jgi:hypothetical protein
MNDIKKMRTIPVTGDLKNKMINGTCKDVVASDMIEEELYSFVGADCWGIEVNGSVLFDGYDPDERTDRMKLMKSLLPNDTQEHTITLYMGVEYHGYNMVFHRNMNETQYTATVYSSPFGVRWYTHLDELIRTRKEATFPSMDERFNEMNLHVYGVRIFSFYMT